MMKFKTTSAYLSGAICGKMWMPAILAGKPVNKSLRGIWGFMEEGDSFVDALHSLLMRDGGDFQNAKFSADSVIRIERKTRNEGGTYSVHVKEIEVSKLAPDLVLPNTFSSDFFGEE